jgi:hypothetical protein
MEASPHALSLSTALETRQSPPDENCAICQELLDDAPPIYGPADERSFNTDRQIETEAVITKICGDKHFFHRVCIESWWKSASPHLNTCPIDRTLCYGSASVRQAAVNPPEYTRFLGHDPHAHGTVHPDGFVEQLLAHWTNRTELNLSDFIAPDVDLERLDYETIHDRANVEHLESLSADDMVFINRARGTAFELLMEGQVNAVRPLVNELLTCAIVVVQALTSNNPEPSESGRSIATMNASNGRLIAGMLASGDLTREELDIAMVITEEIMNSVIDHIALPVHAMENARALFTTDQNVSDLVPEGVARIIAEEANSAHHRHDQPGRNDPLADSIARGLLPAPRRVRPFSAETHLDLYHGLDSIAHMAGFFDNGEDDTGGGDMG